MSILTGFKKVKNYILTSSGYQLLSRWTSSNTVDFDDGKTAQTKVGAINGIVKDKNSLSTVTDDSFAAGAVAVKDAIADVNSKLNITNNVFGINTSIGISIVSINCALCVNNVYYIDVFIQLTETVPENGTLFYVVKNDNAITFKHRLDAILINSLNGKTYQIVLLKDSNIFIATGASIPSGLYKVAMIISI